MKWLWDDATSSDVVQNRLQAALCSLHREYEDPLNPEAAEETLKMRAQDRKVFERANEMLPSLCGEEPRTPQLIPGIPFSDLRQLNMPPLRQTWLRFNCRRRRRRRLAAAAALCRLEPETAAASAPDAASPPPPPLRPSPPPPLPLSSSRREPAAA